jgi:predicted ArsR family transcriptional regulator
VATVAAATNAGGRAHWLEVIADPVRLQILRKLSRVEDATTSELAGDSPASYQTLRRHLEALEASGVISARAGVSDGESGRPATRFSLDPQLRESVRLAIDGRAS